MSRFSNSKVYKLINSIDNKIYIGSTTQSLCKRLADHKKSAKYNPQFVHKHFNTIGWDTVKIILIETIHCFNKEQLTQREQHFIDEYKPELNKWSAYARCPHGREHNRCVDCGGTQICAHDRRISRCKECSPKYCPYCDINTSKDKYKEHTTTKKHIQNSIHS